GRVLAIVAVALSAVVMVSGLLRGRPWSEVVLTAVSLAVAAVPESLPAVVTLALALGARRMARRSAIVRRLAAVETLGSVTVLMTDKTGTLTQGAMSVERIWVADQEYVVSGVGYAPEGDITVRSADGHDAVLGDPHAALHRVLRDAVLCNDADLVAPDDQHPLWRPRGDTTEAALLAAAARADMGVHEQRDRYPRVGEVPFDSVRKRMTTIHRLKEPGAYLVVCKGAPEALAQTPGLVRTFPPALRAEADALAARGLRVLVVADGTAAQPDAAGAEHGLDVVGLIALSDPPRVDAAGVVADVLAAGVKPVMVTGDHPSTAGAIAERLGIQGRVVTSAELGADGLPGQAASADLPGVVARTRPEQKFGIVAALQQQGQVVAMTGDGVNDAPALERADIGVAMGRSGTEVAKQAADVVLTDDRLSTIVLAIAEGRRIYDNIRTFLRYGLAGGAAEVLVMLLGPSVGLAVPLLPGQILWINLLTHGLPGVAFGAERADPQGMHRPPRSPEESVLGAGLWQQVLVTGMVLCASALGAGVLSPGSEEAQQTAVFLALGLGQLGVALALRRRPERGRVLSFLDLAVASSILLQLAAVYVPPLARLLHVAAPVSGHLPVVVALAAVPGLLVLGARLLRRRSLR
ncbi:MAG TPA: cation-transporting P-type ATPase, partial [Marmoricola sp.]|nr:cation-transporting P-type ATPase [Marmoricola sp.]